MSRHHIFCPNVTLIENDDGQVTVEINWLDSYDSSSDDQGDHLSDADASRGPEIMDKLIEEGVVPVGVLQFPPPDPKLVAEAIGFLASVTAD